MKTKLYFGVLALLWLLGSCVDPITENVIEGPRVGVAPRGQKINKLIVNGHDYLLIYIDKGGSLTHAGDCTKCRHELDSIVRNAVNEAFEASMKENWNE